jgi:hypothetical protein
MVAALKLSDIPDTLRERHGNLRRLYKGLAYALGWVNADSKRERSIPPQAGKPPPPPHMFGTCYPWHGSGILSSLALKGRGTHL